jgi:hypothetical protein
MVWEFKLAAGGGWRWRHVPDSGGAPIDSDRAFSTLNDAIYDAERHGYAASSVTYHTGTKEDLPLPPLSRSD